MACSSCGDNVAPKCNKDFTETVVKINNPSKIILFRKVVVPSSMGDETEFPPTVGKYRNVLLQYEATGSIYLYSSDGIPTQISTDVSELIRRINELGAEIRIEEEERIAGDEALSEEIDSLSSSLSDEAEARAQADATLQDNIDAEAQAREDADVSLSADIVAEAQARANADTALGGRIDDVEDDLDTEITNRTNADNQLRNSINNEISARETADETLQNNINTVSSNLAAETSARQNADSALQTNIDTEASTRALADTELNRAISSEVTARQTADNSLQTQIDSIVASSDVKDIVGTHAELEDYDTSTLGNNDIIKVLQDETQNDATTYYRWSTQSQTFSLIGSEGPYYTKSQTNTLLNEKQDTLTAGSNVQIVGNTISATDTKYTAGNGLNLSGTQFSVDTSTIATKSDIPTVNNATLTIQKNGTTVQTFTANSGTNKTANITVPTNNNELTNGAGYQTAADVQTAIAGKQDKLTAGNAIDITNNVVSADIYPEDYFTGDATSCDEGATIEAENPIGVASVELKGNTFQQTYSGKNLFDKVLATASSSDYSLNANGDITTTADNYSTGRRWMSLGTFAAGVYTLSFLPFFIGATNRNMRVSVRITSTSDTIYDETIYGVVDGVLRSARFTLSTSAAIGVCLIPSSPPSSGANIYFSDVQIELGSSATSYEPYVGGTASPNPDYPQEVQTATGRQVVTISNGTESQEYEINLGKNLLDNSSPSAVASTATWSPTVTGGTFSNTAAWGDGVRWDMKVEVGATYTFHADFPAYGEKVWAYLLTCTDNTYSTSKTRLVNDGSGSITKTFVADSEYLRFTILSSSSVNNKPINNIQLEKGSTVSSYAPYFEPIELCKIGDYRDRIYKSGSDWYLRKETAKMVFNGSESSWNYIGDDSGRERFIIPVPDLATQEFVSDAPAVTVSNQFRGTNWWQIYTKSAGDNVMSSHNSVHVLIARCTQFTSLDSFKSWLVNNPLTVYYALATPTDVKIANTTLISQLNALASATAYGEEATIAVSGPNQLVTLDACTFNRTLEGTLAKIDNKQNKLTAGNAIDIDNDIVSAAVYPEDYFTNENATVSGTGTDIELDGTTELSLKNVDLLGDTYQQTYSGKNLLDNRADSTSSYGITITVNSDGSIVGNGTATGLAYVVPMTQQQSETFPAGTYTLSADQVPSAHGQLIVETYKAPDYNTRINNIRGEYGINKITFTTTEPLQFRVSIVFAQNGDTLNNFVVSKLQLESGSSVTSYEPYVGSTPSKLTPAPNPDYPQEVQTATGIQTIELSDGMGNSEDYTVELTATRNVFNSPIEINGIAGDGAAQNKTDRASSTEFTYVSPGATYTLNMKPKTSGKTAQAIIRVWDKNGNWVTSLPSDSWYSLPFTVTMPSNAYKIKLSLRYSDNTTFGTVGDLTDAFEDIQLERGATATEYQPFEPIELCKLSSTPDAPAILNYQDYIYKSGNDWYIHKETAKAVYDGTEDWGTHNTHNGINSFRFYTDNAAHSNSAILADSYRPVYITTYNSDTLRDYGQIATLESTTTTTNKTVFMTSPNSSVTTLTQFKDWLVSNPVTVYYASDATEIQITNEVLIAQLDALASATTYKDSTTITVSSDNTKVILSTSAFTRSYSGTIEAINSKGSGSANVNIGYGLEKSGSTISVDPDVIASKSDIPTVNNATLTIQNDGASVNTFTANASSNVTANVVPWSLEMKDYRNSLIPSNATNKRLTAFFTSEGGLDSQTNDNNFCDAIVMSGWAGTTGGRVNAIVATKVSAEGIYHYTGQTNGNSWNTKKRLAYIDEVESEYLKKSGGAITGAITRNLGSGTIANTNIFTLNGSTDGFAVDYDSSTSDLGITKIYSIDDANAQLSLGNKVGSNYKEAINITNGVATVNGNSSTATKLATPRTIGLGTGANGTATSFDGSANITIPVTDVKESYVTWGGKTHTDGDMTPGVMGCIDEFSHNKFAFLPAKQINVAFSRDGGSTWLDYTTGNGANETVSDGSKITLVTYDGHSLYAGGRTTGTNTAADDRLRIRIHNLDGTTNRIYTDLKEILINVSSEGTSVMKVQIRHRTIANYQNNVDTWTTVGTYNLGGWSGWNSIPYIYRFGGSSNQTSQIGEMELVFWATGRASNNKNMIVSQLRFIGSNAWNTPSEMAKTGRLYKIDASQNATFPANVKVTGSLQHSSYTYQLPSADGTLATITMTTTDPGEGATIADGQFIAVYDA